MIAILQYNYEIVFIHTLASVKFRFLNYMNFGQEDNNFYLVFCIVSLNVTIFLIFVSIHRASFPLSLAIFSH